MCVETFSDCKLAYPGDKFVAIRGVASALELWLNDDFIAGAWKKSLLEDLLWSKAYHDKHLSLPPKYRSPSWSWMSVDGKIGFYHIDHDAAKSFHSTSLEIQTPKSPAENPTDAFIRLRGPLKQSDLYEASMSGFRFGFRDEFWISGRKFRLDLKLDLAQNLNWYGDRSQDRQTIDCPIMTKTGFTTIKVSKLFFLPIMTAPDIVTGVDTMTGIALVPTGLRKGDFFRVGYFEVDEEDSRKSMLAPSTDIDFDHFESSRDGGLFTIHIV